MRVTFDYWTKERVDAGLQLFINDIYEEHGIDLPASLTGYDALIPAHEKNKFQKQRKYPPTDAILRHYESFAAAWWNFGFLVEVKSKKVKYPRTLEHEEMMQLIYRYKNDGKNRPTNVPAGAKEYAKSLGYPDWVGSKWASDLGLSHVKELPWSDKEIELLDKYGYFSVHHLELLFKKHGFKRTEAAIRLMRKRRMSAKAAPYYSFNSLAELLGVDQHKVNDWGQKGWLKFICKGTLRSAETAQNGDTRLTHKVWIYDFICKHPKEFSIRNADQLWLFHLLTKGDVGLGYSNELGKRVESQTIESPMEFTKKRSRDRESEPQRGVVNA